MKRWRPGLASSFFLSLRPDPGPYHGHDSRFLAGRVTGPEAAVVGEDEEEEGEGDDAVVVAAATAAEEEGPERRCRCKLESSRSVFKACVAPALTRSARCSLPAVALSAGSRPPPCPRSGPGLFRCRNARGCGSAALRTARQELLVFFLCPPTPASLGVPEETLMWLLRCCRRLSRGVVAAAGRMAAAAPLTRTEPGHVRGRSAARLSFSRAGRRR